MARTDESTPRGDVALLGGSGMLGQCWVRSLRSQPITEGLIAPAQTECDLTRPGDIERAIHPRVGMVINCAAYTDVDGAEAHEDAATALNGDAVGLLAQRCKDVGALFVHYSTDYVFNGAQSEPYLVDQRRDPINAYGRSKAAGEAQLEQAGCDFLLIRTSWLYAPHGENFVGAIAGLCTKKPSLRVVNDQVGRPTSADHLVALTRRLLDTGARGIHHACDGGQCTWFQFARAIADRVNPRCVIEPCSSDEFPRPAARPAYSVLDLSHTITAIGAITHWSEALADVLDRLPAQRAVEEPLSE